MKKSFLLVIVILGLTLAVSYSQNVDFGVGFTPGYDYQSQKKVEIPKSLLVDKIAEHFKLDSEKLQKLYRTGYGHLELIKLITIAVKSDQSFDEILKLRIKKEKISQIAKKFNLNYEEIYKDSYKIKSDLEGEVEEYSVECSTKYKKQ